LGLGRHRHKAVFDPDAGGDGHRAAAVAGAAPLDVVDDGILVAEDGCPVEPQFAVRSHHPAEASTGVEYRSNSDQVGDVAPKSDRGHLTRLETNRRYLVVRGSLAQPEATEVA